MPSLRPTTAAEVIGFIHTARAGYIGQRVAAGEAPDEARRIAEEQTQNLFPRGKPAPGHIVYRVVDDDGTDVGSLWIGPHTAEQPQAFWVWEVAIDDAYRGRGLGRAAMVLAEEAARAQGATELGLNVFGPNTVARHLYESLGYQTTAVQMRKLLA